MKARILLAILIANMTVVYSQTIQTFDQPLPIRSAYIEVMKTQPDGKILIGGDIAYYGDTRVDNLVRINPDGTLDNTFNFHRGGDGFYVIDIERADNGDLFILTYGYRFFDMTYTGNNYIINTDSQGTIKKEIKVENSLNCLALQEDGKLLVGTWATSETSGKLIRFHEDLSLDTDFENKVTVNRSVGDILVMDDKILMSGNFSTVNGQAYNGIVKLNLDGSIDESFDIGLGTEDYIGSLTLQPDGKILLGKSYINSFDGIQHHGFGRLNADGSVDTEFQVNSPYLNGGTSGLIYTDEGIYASAYWYGLDLEPGRAVILRLKHDGSMDPEFTPVATDFLGNAQLAYSDNQLYASHTQFSGNVFGLSRIAQSGEVDNAFKPEIGRFGTIKFGDELDGKLLIAGDFIRINGIETFGVARLNTDGSVDETFRLKENKRAVEQIKVLDDETVLVTTHTYFFKLNKEGDIVPEFHWEHFQNQWQIIKFIVKPSGQIMVGDANQISRLNADGSHDESFDINGMCCWVSTAFDFDLQGDKIIYGSMFSNLGGVDADYLARLGEDGKVDETFNIGTGPDNADYNVISLVKVLDNNEILVGGMFSEFDGHDVPYGLVKLSPDGAVDETFLENQRNSKFGGYFGAWLYAQVEQIESKIFIRGSSSVYVVNVDGTIEDFTIPAVVNNITDVVVESTPPDGRTAADDKVMFALGTFKVAGTTEPSFILKLGVDVSDSGNPILATEKSDVETFQIYPQPVTNTLKIQLPAAKEDYSATIFDASGNRFTQKALRKSEAPSEIDMNNAPAGLYLLRVTSERTGQSAVKKFIKSN